MAIRQNVVFAPVLQDGARTGVFDGRRRPAARIEAVCALGVDVDSMQVEVRVGVPKPEQVDHAAVLAVLPHGTGTVTVVEGGLEIPNEAGTGSTVMAHAAAIVRLDLPERAA